MREMLFLLSYSNCLLSHSYHLAINGVKAFASYTQYVDLVNFYLKSAPSVTRDGYRSIDFFGFSFLSVNAKIKD